MKHVFFIDGEESWTWKDLMQLHTAGKTPAQANRIQLFLFINAVPYWTLWDGLTSTKLIIWIVLAQFVLLETAGSVAGGPHLFLIIRFSDTCFLLVTLVWDFCTVSLLLLVILFHWLVGFTLTELCSGKISSETSGFKFSGERMKLLQIEFLKQEQEGILEERLSLTRSVLHFTVTE